MTTLSTLPAAFTALHGAGRFDYWGAPYRSLSDEQREARMRSHRHRVLWWRPIEWDRSPAEVLATPLDEADYGGFRPGLVPFAGNGYGDAYCWYPRWQDGSEPPVVLALHDEETSSLFARDFAECLVRCLLIDGLEPADDLEAEEQARLFRAHHEIIRPYLTPEQCQLLAPLSAHFSNEACAVAEQVLASRIPRRSLTGIVLPVQYSEKYFTSERLARAYRDSEAYYQELVESEGLAHLAPRLEQVRDRLRRMGL